MTWWRRFRHDDSGQATVEFVLVLPLLVLMLLAAVQVALVVRDQLAVIATARDAARAVVVADGRTAAAQSAGSAASSLHPTRRSIAVSRSGDLVTVVVRYRSPTDLPLIGVFLPDITVNGTATMTIEA